MKHRPIASSRPNYNIVRVKGRFYTYSRITKKELDEIEEFLQLFHQISKITLRRVKNICKKDKNEILQVNNGNKGV